MKSPPAGPRKLFPSGNRDKLFNERVCGSVGGKAQKGIGNFISVFGFCLL